MVYMGRDLRIPVRIPKNTSRFTDAESGRTVRRTLQNAFIAGFPKGEIREGIIKAGKECTCKREGTIYDEGKKNVQFRMLAHALTYDKPSPTQVIRRAVDMFSPSGKTPVLYFDDKLERVPLAEVPPWDVSSILYHIDKKMKIPITDHFEAVMLAVSALRITGIHSYPGLVYPILDYENVSSNVAIVVPSNECGTIQTFFLNKELPPMESIEIIDDRKAVAVCYALLAKGLVNDLAIEPATDTPAEEIPLAGVSSNFMSDDISIAAYSNYYWPQNHFLRGLLVSFKEKVKSGIEKMLKDNDCSSEMMGDMPQSVYLVNSALKLLIDQIEQATAEISNSN